MRLLRIASLIALALNAREPLAQRIAHTDPSKYQTVQAVHNGAGQIAYQVLLDSHSLDTNLCFLHRGVIAPKSSLGHHFHNNCEEMYVILDGEAQFTVDGRTSLLKAPSGAPCRLGHSHALYNATDQPVQFLNINVSMLKGENDAFNLGDPRTSAALDPIPVFMSFVLDKALLAPAKAMSAGSGAVNYRRAIPPSVFAGPWAYVDHIELPQGTVLAQQTHRGVAEVYYVLSGAGNATVAGETAPIKTGDAIPVQLNEAHAFQNTGSSSLELLLVGISRERNKETQ
jgi:mannose-6-phosphate isomerase-like protein (cupin superfamily)